MLSLLKSFMKDASGLRRLSIYEGDLHSVEVEEHFSRLAVCVCLQSAAKIRLKPHSDLREAVPFLHSRVVPWSDARLTGWETKRRSTNERGGGAETSVSRTEKRQILLLENHAHAHPADIGAVSATTDQRKKAGENRRDELELARRKTGIIQLYTIVQLHLLR